MVQGENGANSLITKAHKVGDSYEQITDQNQKYRWATRCARRQDPPRATSSAPADRSAVAAGAAAEHCVLVRTSCTPTTAWWSRRWIVCAGLPIGGLANEFNSWSRSRHVVGLEPRTRATGYE